MKILAVTLEKCSGCSLMIDNKIIFSTSEERYSRIKSDSSFPIESITHALEFANLQGNELDQVIICGNMLSLIPSLTNEYSTLDVDEQLKLMKDYWYPTLVEKKSISFLELIKDKINLDKYPFNTKFAKDFDYFSLENPYTEDDAKRVSNFFKNILSDLLKIEQSKIIHMEHDWCHAAYAFYGSPISDNNTLVVTADAWGDDLSGSISIFDKEKNQLKRIKEYVGNETFCFTYGDGLGNINISELIEFHKKSKTLAWAPPCPVPKHGEFSYKVKSLLSALQKRGVALRLPSPQFKVPVLLSLIKMPDSPPSISL